MHIAKPTKQQLAWHEMELGVIIHYCMDIYNPAVKYKTMEVRTGYKIETLNPKKLDPGQWVRSAAAMGAKYAVLVANHCTGFSLWPTKENDFSVASMAWKDGKGDMVREFIDACKKYDMKPGLYYSCGCNGYYGINDSEIGSDPSYDYKNDYYQEYVRHVEAQVKELWTEYGELFEIWFDGGVIPVEQGGPDLVPMLLKYQPNAIAFQGPRDYPHNLRWVGNEDGLAPENCWATTNAGEARYDGTVPDEAAGVGDPDGKYYWPAETDMPNRTHAAFGGGWAWAPNEEHLLYTPEQLLDCYIRSVGRNSNLLLGMAISTDGDFQDEEQFAAFGKLIRETFGNPLAVCESPAAGQDVTLTLPEGKPANYLVIREKIDEGQHIRAFTVLADGKEIYKSHCVGHKRIIPLNGLTAKEITFRVTEAAPGWALRDVAVC